MLESTIERYLDKRVRAAGGVTYKFVSPGRVNVPDRIIIWPPFYIHDSAIVVFVEVKAPGEKPRPAQLREINRLRAAGCTVCVCDSKEWVDLFVEGWADR